MSAWQHVMMAGLYLAVALAISALNGRVGRGPGLSFREGFAISAMLWVPGMAVLYLLLGVLPGAVLA